MSYVRNMWYAAAWSDEVPPGVLFHRTYLEEPVLIYRRGDGVAAAISNRCPHRFAPLHMGKLIGDNVECPYHGLVFNSQGACVGNPHGSGVTPKAATARPYPLVERHNVLWIWMGDPAIANPELIVDFGFMTDTENWSTIYGYIHLKANYELVIDNLTDLSHAPFVHEGLLESRDVCKGKFKLSRDGDHAKTVNWCPGIAPPPFFEMLKGTQEFKDESGLVDHWQDMTYDPPGCMNTLYGITRRGRPREEGMATLNPNLVTPETSKSTHYFWAGSRNFSLNDSVVNEQFRRGYDYAFQFQDRPILEGVQANMGDASLNDLEPVLLINDGCSVHARRVMERRRKEEALERTHGK